MTKKWNRRAVGTEKEHAAGEYLKTRGYQILQYNFRCRIGEIDIVAKEDDYLVFVEVKYRKDIRCGYPAEAVTAAKQRTISKVAAYYLLTHGYAADTPCRFDVAAVLESQIEVLKNAFPYQGFPGL